MSVKRRPNKMESLLNSEEMEKFNRQVACYSNPTLKDIIRLAKRYDVRLTSASARTYKKKTFKEYLTELKATRQFAATLSSVSQGDQKNITKATSTVLLQKVFSLLTESRRALDPVQLEKLTRALTRLNEDYRRDCQMERQFKATSEENQASKKEPDIEELERRLKIL